MEPEAVRAPLASLRFPFLWVLSLLSLYGGPIRRPAGAFRSPFSVAVEGLALRACTLRSPGRASALPVSSPPEAAARAPTSGAPPSLQTSKLPSFQATKKEPRGVGSRAVTTTRKECELTQKMAGRTGLEPATSGSTVRSSNQLSYLPEKEGFLSWKMAGRTGLEPATSGSTVRSSNQLSYLPESRKHA